MPTLSKVPTSEQQYLTFRIVIEIIGKKNDELKLTFAIILAEVFDILTHVCAVMVTT